MSKREAKDSSTYASRGILIAIVTSAERVAAAKVERLPGSGRCEELVGWPPTLATSRTAKTFRRSRRTQTDRVDLAHPLITCRLEIFYQLTREIVGSRRLQRAHWRANSAGEHDGDVQGIQF